MKILIIEDEAELADSIVSYLEGNNAICTLVSTIHEAINKIQTLSYDCVLLDLSLPDGNGLDFLKELKKNNRDEGIIVISAKETLESKLEGLSLGADDYLTKPFHLSELLMRVIALIRRKNFDGKNLLNFEEIEIDLLSKTVMVHQKNIELTKKEIELLLLLIGNKNRVLSKGAIAEYLSGDMAEMLDNHDFIYAHVKNLKKKLFNAGCGDYIKSIYGLGYKWQYD